MTEPKYFYRTTILAAAKRFAVMAAAVLLCVTTSFGQTNPAAIKAALAEQPSVVEAAWWGFDETESTKALQAAIDSGADKVIVSNRGKPWIVDKIELASDQELYFEKDCVVLAKRGAFKGKNDSLFTARLKQNVTLNGNGATFRMWKSDYHTDAYARAEWRHCLSILSSNNVKVYGLTLADSGGDGIYLGVAQRGVTNKNVHIKDVICDGNNRQGISVISAENLLIEDSVLKNTSGTAPQAGIDFEPNHPGEKVVNCVMRNCVAENNVGPAYVLYLRPLDGTSAPISVRIEDCVSRGSNAISASITTANGGPKGPPLGQIDFVDCRFEDTGTAGISVRDLPVDACRVRFENCTLADASDKPTRGTPIVFTARVGSTQDVGGVEFVDCKLVEPVDRPLMAFEDYAGDLKVLDVTGTLKVVRDGTEQVVPITEQLLDELMPTRTMKRIQRYDLTDTRFVPVFPDATLPSTKPQLARQRKHGEYLIYATQGDAVQLRVRYLKVGGYGGSDMKIPVLDEAGKRIATLTAPFQQDTQCSFTAPETGTFKLVCDAGGNSVHVDSPTHRLCLVGTDNAISLISTSGDFYFWVPGSVAEFGVKIYGAGGERVNAAVFDPAGTQVWVKQNIDIPTLYEGKPRTAGKDEVWRVRIGKPTDGAFEDNYIELRGVPNVLAYTPEALLKPK
ncbi:right-handed parallel beta-helix repeat-containing protein [Novipirellula sp. SH528]|uniref:right-handed parallel beta-helix repeat-containing protein n=1 Tax=Novipirellula sp. SH528 TaxID=3454466 RepID=UPI003FA103AA